MRISGNEPSSVILSQKRNFLKLKRYVLNAPKQADVLLQAVLLSSYFYILVLFLCPQNNSFRIFVRIRQIIRYRPTATLRGPQINNTLP